MSSATSTKTSPLAEADSRFKPWHFFVLASLTMATVAVIMSRRATPEHLILISFTIGAAGAAAAGFYRMLAPLASDDAAMFSEPLSGRSRAAMEREKSLVLRSIKELEFDRAMGKLSQKDFDEMAGRLRARAIMLMKQLDDGATGYRELIERELTARLGARGAKPRPDTAAPVSTPAGYCTACRTANDADAAFCKRCGSKLEPVASAVQGDAR
jgi:hypothetical protein